MNGGGGVVVYGEIVSVFPTCFRVFVFLFLIFF